MQNENICIHGSNCQLFPYFVFNERTMSYMNHWYSRNIKLYYNQPRIVP